MIHATEKKSAVFTGAGGCDSRARPHCRERGGRAGRAVLRIKGQHESCGTENETELRSYRDYEDVDQLRTTPGFLLV